jgi:hypothetical protein
MVWMNEGKSRQEIVKGTTIPVERGNMPKCLRELDEGGIIGLVGRMFNPAIMG